MIFIRKKAILHIGVVHAENQQMLSYCPQTSMCTPQTSDPQPTKTDYFAWRPYVFWWCGE